MKRIYILLFTLLLCLVSKAQTLDSLKIVANDLKAEYGVQDERYLNSLSEIVLFAINNEDYRTAYEYRRSYYNIIKDTFGAESPEYADACIRMGTVSYLFIGTNEAINYYLEALALYDKLGIFDSTYIQGVSMLCEMYLESGEHDTYLKIHNQLIKTLEKSGDDYLIFLLNEYVKSYAALLQYEDYVTLLNYANKAQKLIKKNGLGYIMPEQTSIAFALPRICYRNLGDIDKAIVAGKETQNYYKDTFGEDSVPYAKFAIILGLDYIDLNEYEKAFAYISEGLRLIEDAYIREGISVYSEETYLPATNSLALLLEMKGDQQGAIEYRQKADQAFRAMGDISSDDFFRNLYDLFIDYSSCGNYVGVASIFNDLEKWVISHYGADSEEYFNVLINAHDSYIYTYNKEKTLSIDEKIMTFTNKPKSFGMFLKASTLLQFNEYEKAIPLLKQSLEVISNNPTEDESRLIPMCYNSLGYATMEFDPKEAEEYLLKAIEYNDRYITDMSGANIDPLVNLGMIYYKSSSYTKAIKYFNQALDLATNEQNIYKATTCLNNIGLCYLYSGEMVKGIRILEEVLDMAEKTSGKMSLLYATTLQNITIYYGNLQEQDMCIAITEEIANIYANILGEDSANYGGAIYNLGVFNMLKKEYDKSIEYCKQAAMILEKAQGDNRLMLSNIYETLGFDYFITDRTEEGQEAYGRSARLLQELKLDNSIHAVSLLYNYGYALLSKNNKKAVTYLKDAVIIANELDMLNHPIALSALSVYGLASLLDDGPEEGYIDLVVDTQREQYLNNFGQYNEEEREQFWSHFALLDDILFSCRRSESENASLYNYTLATKGMLLNTSVNMADIIRKSGNKELMDDYMELTVLRQRINKLEQIPTNERIESLDSLNALASSIERTLISSSKEYGELSSSMNIFWEEISSSLKKNEVAIEFVNFTDYKVFKEYYAALILRKDWQSPQFITLAEADDLNAAISGNNLDSYEVRINNIYSNTTTYNLIWKPLERFINEGDKVYFSASGILHNLSVEHLVDNNDIYASDKYDLRRVSSTRDVVLKNSVNTAKHYKNATLYGGILYDLDEDVMKQESEKYNLSITRSMELEAYDTLRSDLIYLRGSEIEVKSVSEILNSKGISSSVYKGKEANEESFKYLDSRTNDILHIATHGFYLPTEKVETNNFLKMMPVFVHGANTSIQSNPIKTSMQRSGLVFAGGNKAWKGEKVSDTIEDGIATSAEIANMNLAGTDLLVLSACETGLGEVNDEGVFGLQRAFKKAGVNTIIMSLWKVSDHITQQMMRNFYTYLLNGDTKNEAFRKAKKDIRNDYPNPYQWAAFIMMD